MIGCKRREATDVVCYCGVDEPYAREVFTDFQRQTGIRVSPEYDIESSKSVGLSGKLEAEKAHPRADVWWGSEAFLSVRLAEQGILTPYQPATADGILPNFRDPSGYWTGCGVRARVLAVGVPPPPFRLTGIQDLADPRLKDKVTISRPTAGATGAHLAALYSTWGPEKAKAFLRKLHDNGIVLLGGNAEVANQVGLGTYTLGLTDSDDVTNTQANGGKLSAFLPDQNGEGTLAMPTTVGLVTGAHNVEGAKKLIDYIASSQAEKKLIDLKFARWSVRGGSGADALKAMPVDYAAAAKLYAQAQQEGTAILEGR